MERQNDRAYWKHKASELLTKQRGILNVNLRRDDKGTATLPAVGGDDGIYMGIMTKDMEVVARDGNTTSSMLEAGYDVGHNAMDQIRFKRPEMYKAIADSIIAIQATNEPVLCLVTDYSPLPEVHLLKMAPISDNEIMWTMMNVAKLAATTVTHWGPEVAEYLEENALTR